MIDVEWRPVGDLARRLAAVRGAVPVSSRAFLASSRVGVVERLPSLCLRGQPVGLTEEPTSRYIGIHAAHSPDMQRSCGRGPRTQERVAPATGGTQECGPRRQARDYVRDPRVAKDHRGRRGRTATMHRRAAETATSSSTSSTSSTRSRRSPLPSTSSTRRGLEQRHPAPSERTLVRCTG